MLKLTSHKNCHTSFFMKFCSRSLQHAHFNQHCFLLPFSYKICVFLSLCCRHFKIHRFVWNCFCCSDSQFALLSTIRYDTNVSIVNFLLRPHAHNTNSGSSSSDGNSTLLVKSCTPTKVRLLTGDKHRQFVHTGSCFDRRRRRFVMHMQ